MAENTKNSQYVHPSQIKVVVPLAYTPISEVKKGTFSMVKQAMQEQYSEKHGWLFKPTVKPSKGTPDARKEYSLETPKPRIGFSKGRCMARFCTVMDECDSFVKANEERIHTLRTHKLDEVKEAEAIQRKARENIQKCFDADICVSTKDEGNEYDFFTVVSKLTVDELKAQCKAKKLTGYSKMRKDHLILVLAAALQEEAMELQTAGELSESEILTGMNMDSALVTDNDSEGEEDSNSDDFLTNIVTVNHLRETKILTEGDDKGCEEILFNDGKGWYTGTSYNLCYQELFEELVELRFWTELAQMEADKIQARLDKHNSGKEKLTKEQFNTLLNKKMRLVVNKVEHKSLKSFYIEKQKELLGTLPVAQRKAMWGRYFGEMTDISFVKHLPDHETIGFMALETVRDPKDDRKIKRLLPVQYMDMSKADEMLHGVQTHSIKPVVDVRTESRKVWVLEPNPNKRAKKKFKAVEKEYIDLVIFCSTPETRAQIDWSLGNDPENIDNQEVLKQSQNDLVDEMEKVGMQEKAMEDSLLDSPLQDWERVQEQTGGFVPFCRTLVDNTSGNSFTKEQEDEGYVQALEQGLLSYDDE